MQAARHMGQPRCVRLGSVSSSRCVTDASRNVEAIRQKLLSVIINMLECDRRGFIFMLAPWQPEQRWARGCFSSTCGHGHVGGFHYPLPPVRSLPGVFFGLVAVSSGGMSGVRMLRCHLWHQEEPTKPPWLFVGCLVIVVRPGSRNATGKALGFPSSPPPKKKRHEESKAASEKNSSEAEF